MLFRWRASVADGGPTFEQQWINVSYLLGHDAASMFVCNNVS